MILLIDNYDSFVYNIYHYLTDITKEEILVKRNDKISIEEIVALKPSHIIISPGPCTPNEAGISLDIIDKFKGKVPIFGVCLGHQAIGQYFGGNVVKTAPYHGRVANIKHNGNEMFRGVAEKFKATRYHSLVIDRASCPECLEITAVLNDDNQDELIMAVSHKKFPIFGVQFHPESISSEYGHQILRNFLNL